jgi:signal transduction histidine kinase
MKLFVEILFNLGTIATLGIVSGLIGAIRKKNKQQDILHGVLFGIGALIGMLQPVMLHAGLFFDGRSVMISLAALFFGPIAGLISALMAISLRIYQGGMGTLVGSLVSLASALWGIMFYLWNKKKQTSPSALQLYFFGLLVHTTMVLLMFTLPAPLGWSTVRKIAFPVLSIYPAATLLIGLIINLLKSKEKILMELNNLNQQLESKVNMRTRDLEESNKALEAFSYSVSHDLRAPLRAINGFSNILNSEYAQELGSEGQRLLSVISNNAVKMDELISGLLSMAKIAKNELKKSLINTQMMVNECLKDLIPEEDQNRFCIELEELPMVYGDPILIRQVWYNLIDNALKFSRNRKLSKIKISGFDRGAFIDFGIRDNGIGFSQEYKDKLFKTFERLHSPQDFEGTGIGLALVGRIIQKHGGKVWAEGEPDQGARFFFSLPKF